MLLTCNLLARCLKADHCESCHQDLDMGEPTTEIEIRGREVTVCCAVMRAFDERQEARA